MGSYSPLVEGQGVRKKQASGAWKNFIADCRKLDAKSNDVVFKKHFIDEQDFAGAEEKLFKDIC